MSESLSFRLGRERYQQEQRLKKAERLRKHAERRRELLSLQRRSFPDPLIHPRSEYVTAEEAGEIKNMPAAKIKRAIYNGEHPLEAEWGGPGIGWLIWKPYLDRTAVRGK